ncbi:hypothetical protein [Micromonospora sp. DT233]|uniref:hypothetical protein n=1 Tax=Micromonospora sp. DT233 TaxID=3393432 RepID=UPI003CF2C982
MEPHQLGDQLRQLVRLINRNAGRLPVDAVVTARQITDLLGEIVERWQTHPIDAYAASSVQGMVDDYLPTSLTSYLALDPSQFDAPQGLGATAAQCLREQLESLLDSAWEVRAALRRDDANALIAQGVFLRTKFSRSDLDIP